MQRKFCGFPYISSTLTIVPLILMDSYFPTPRTREFSYPTTLQFHSLLDSSDTTSDIPYADLGPRKGTICWLVGAWPRFKDDLSKQIPILLALSVTIRGVRTKVSPEVVWKGARTRFFSPWRCLMISSGPRFDPMCTSLCMLTRTSQLEKLSSRNPTRGSNNVITQVPPCSRY